MIIYKGKNGLSSKEMIRVSLSSKPMKIFGFTVTTILILGVIYSTCRSVYSREHWHNINLLSNSALVGGFLSGGLHALTGSDHLAALLPLIIGKGGWHSCFYGAVWGTGHGLTSAVLGFLSYGMKNYILKWQSAGEESGDEGFLHQCGYLVDGAVGMTLIVIGMMGYYEEKSSSGSSEEVSKEEKQSMPAAGSRLEHLDTAVCSSSSGSGSRSSNHHHEYQYDDDGVIIDEEKGLKSESKVNTGRKLKSSGTERNWSWSRYWHHVEVRQCIAAGAVFMNGCMLGVSWDGLPSLAPTLVLRYPGPLLQFLFGYALATVLMMAFTAGLVGEVTQWVSHRLEASYNNNNNNNNSSSTSSTSSSSSSSSGSSSGSSSTGTGAGLSHRLAHMSSLLAVFIGACWCLSGLIKCAHHHHHQQQLQLPVLQQPFLPAAAAAAAATASASYSKTDVSYPSAVTPSSDGIIHSTVRQKMRLSPPAVNSRSSTSTSISDSNAVGYRSGTVGEERGHAWIEFNNNTDINYDNNDGTSTGIDAEIAAESDAFDSLNDGTGINTFMSAASYSSRATVMRAGHPPPPPPPPPHHHHNSALVILATLLLCGVSVVAVIAVVLAAIYSEFGNDSRNGHMVIVSNGNTDGSAQTYEYSCISRLWKSAINRASLGSKLTKVHTV